MVICVTFMTFSLIYVASLTVVGVAYPTLLVDIHRLSDGYEGYFLKKNLLPSKIFCRLSDGYIGVT